MNIFVLVAAAAMALASCQKPEIENVEPQEYEYTFLIGSADTKATVGETCVEWEKDDKMGVYAKTSGGEISYNAKGFITPAESGESAIMQVYSFKPLAVDDMIYTYYPYTENNSNVPTEVALSIPALQDGKDDMPMVSIPLSLTSSLDSFTNTPVEAGAIKLVNLGSVIEFNVYTETDAYAAELVESVTFEADNALAGEFTFDLTKVNYSDESTLSISDLTETTVVANASDLAVGTKEDPAIVRMVVAPGTYAGSIIVKTDAATYTFPISSAKEFKRSAIKPLGLNFESKNVIRVENAPEAWVLTELTDIKTGDQVVIVSTKDGNSYAMSNDNGTSAPSAVEVKYSDNMLSQAPAENLVWSFEVTNDNQYSFYKDSNNWLYCTNANNGVKVGNNSNKLFKLQDNYLYHVAQGRYLGVYNSQNWRCYTSINTNIAGQTFLFFVKTVGVETPDVPMTPELAVDPATVKVAAAGGDAEFGYTVTNPTEGVSVSASTEANWISGFVYSTANKVSFTVAENTATEAREAVITLSYTGAESKTVTVKQDAKVPEGMKVDVLTRATTGVEGTTYAEWSGKTVATSSAVYAGQSAGGNDAIQLRSDNNNSGIVTTISGGYVKKVVVTWNSNTLNGRTLNVYGKNSAYSTATELYDSNTQGTLLGTIVYGTSIELEVTGNYQYIGLRSADAAMYLDEIKITWSSEASDAPVVPELAVNPATVEVAAAGGNAEFGYTIIYPADGVSVSASTEATWISGFTYSIANKVTFTVAENTSTEVREAVITLSYTGAESKTITVKQDAAESDPGTGGGEGSEPVTVSKLISEISGTTTNGTKVSELKLDDVITASASTGGDNGKVYEYGQEWRLYMSANGTVTISAIEGYTISTVKFTYKYSNSGVLLKGTTQIKSGDVDTVNAQYVTYTVGRTGGTNQGQVKVTAIEVVYQAD